MRNKKMIYCVTGGDGCGKSALASSLAKRLRAETGLDARVVSVWDLLDRGDIARTVPFDVRRLDDYLAAISPRARFYFLVHCIAEALDAAMSSSADALVLDCYAYKYAACEIAHGMPEAEVRAVLAQLPRPDVVMLVDLDPRLAAARKARFTRYESGFASTPGQEHFIAFQTRVRRALCEIALAESFEIVDGDADRSSVAERAWAIVERRARVEEAA
jgi:thymidylate kinase